MCVRVCLCVVSVSCFDRPHRSRDFNLRHRRTPAGNSVPKVNKLETTASGRGEKKPHLRILRALQDSVAVCVRLRLFYSSQRKEPNVPGSTQHQHSTGLAWCDHSFPRTSPFIFLTAQIDLESGVASGKKKKRKKERTTCTKYEDEPSTLWNSPENVVFSKMPLVGANVQVYVG